MSDNPFASPAPQEDLPISPEVIGGGPIPESYGALKTIFILCLILGGMGLVASLFGVLGLALQSTIADMQPTASDPITTRMQEMQQSQMIPNAIMIVLNMFVAPLLLIGSIGGLMKKKWAHRLLRIGLVAAIVFNIFRGVVGCVMQYQLMNALGAAVEQQAVNAQQAAMGNGMVTAGMAVAIIFSVVFTLAYVGFYIWCWIYTKNEKTQRYFDQSVEVDSLNY